ncbi:MAG TPA: hypothetical protein ENI86_04760 [Acidimicrobiales bacterium]|nr:hypothetical protein [Acidimicrobiales bacterium]
MDTGAGPETVGRGAAPSRRVALVITLAVTLVVLSPALLGRSDDFPLSTFPMFSRAVAPVGGIDTVVGFTASGGLVRLPPEIVAGTDEVIVAGSVVTRAVAGGPEASSRLCEAAAGRLTTDGSERYTAVVRLEVRSETYDAIGWFQGDRTPVSIVVRSRCVVSP